MKIFKTLTAFVLATSISLSCSKVETGRIVLTGDITGDPVELVVVSYLPGQSIGYHYPEVSDGKFEFTLDNVEGFTDLIVSVGGVEFGARVNALDTLKMSFVVNKYLEDVDVTYSANEKESRIWTDFYQTYLHWSNYDISPERDNSLPYDESIAKLDECDYNFREKYKADFDSYYERRANLAHDLLKCILIELKSYETGVDPLNAPEYLSMLEKVDPNDPDQVLFPMANRWMSYEISKLEGSMIDKYILFMQQHGSRLTNPEVKMMMVENMLAYCLMDIDFENLELYEKLFDEIEKFVPQGSELVAQSRRQIEAANNAQPGKPVPDTFLRTPDGQEVKLSSLFGKVLYVDVWATWCGPCVKEGPYFRALAEKYKNDPRITFISLSTDDTDEPWLAFLSKEKPFWPQYRLDGANQADFCSKVGINTIPRFLLIDAEGNFINADCERPSSNEIESILNRTME